MVSREEMGPVVLVYHGTWRLRPKQFYTLANVTVARPHLAKVMTSGQRIRRLVGVKGL